MRREIHSHGEEALDSCLRAAVATDDEAQLVLLDNEVSFVVIAHSVLLDTIGWLVNDYNVDGGLFAVPYVSNASHLIGCFQSVT